MKPASKTAAAAAAALAVALSACSGLTHKGKTAPACAGPISRLNPEESEPFPNTFNDLHRGVRPARPGHAS